MPVMSSGPDLFLVCKSCGAEVSPYITECPYCGTRIQKRAPKLDRGGVPRAAKKARSRPSLPRLRPGEIPGIRADRRPYATIALVLVSVLASLAFRSGVVGLRHLVDVVAVSPLDGDYWKLVTQLFVYVDSTGYEVAALGAVFLFGWLLERRHGPFAVLALFLLCGAGGIALTAAVDPTPLAVGGNGAGLGLLCAWAVPDVLARARNEEYDGDLLGALAIALVLLLMPLAALEASAIAGFAGAAAGLLAGLVLHRLHPA
jgi:membrane associated rhomboid family serine protease